MVALFELVFDDDRAASLSSSATKSMLNEPAACSRSTFSRFRSSALFSTSMLFYSH